MSRLTVCIALLLAACPASPPDSGSCPGGEASCGCEIDGTRYQAEAANPDDACALCDPARSSTAWSSRAAGSPCEDDGNPCTGDSCDPQGSCAHPKLADGTSCGASRVCHAGTCGTGCSIDGTLYGQGAANPGNSCQVCDPSRSVSAWTSLAAGAACSDDGNPCTADTCDALAVCQHPAAVDGTSCGAGKICSEASCAAACLVDGEVLDAGAINPASACQTCNPGRSTTDWTNLTAGAPCPDDGDPCTADACDAGGACVHAVRANGSSCGTGRVCAEGSCQAGCWISGAFHANGTVNPANACQSCQAASSISGWRNLANGTECGEGQVCSAGSCTEGCFIDGALRATGELQADQPCQRCDPALSLSAWSASPDATPCGEGECLAGACVMTCAGNGLISSEPRSRLAVAAGTYGYLVRGSEADTVITSGHGVVQIGPGGAGASSPPAAIAYTAEKPTIVPVPLRANGKVYLAYCGPKYGSMNVLRYAELAGTATVDELTLGNGLSCSSIGLERHFSRGWLVVPHYSPSLGEWLHRRWAPGSSGTTSFSDHFVSGSNVEFYFDYGLVADAWDKPQVKVDSAGTSPGVALSPEFNSDTAVVYGSSGKLALAVVDYEGWPWWKSRSEIPLIWSMAPRLFAHPKGGNRHVVAWRDGDQVRLAVVDGAWLGPVGLVPGGGVNFFDMDVDGTGASLLWSTDSGLFHQRFTFCNQ